MLPIAFAVLGCVLLVLVCGVTFTFGLLVFVIDDACSAADFTDGPIHCRNADAAQQILMITPVIAGPIAAAWLVVSEWVPVF